MEEKATFNDLVPLSRNGDVIEMVDPNTPKFEQIEIELEEVKVGLKAIAEIGAETLPKLAKIAESAQHPLMYASFAKVVSALNETHRDIASVLNSKRDLYLKQGKTNEPIMPSGNVTNNILNVSTTEMLDILQKIAARNE